MAKASVIIPCYNQGRYLSSALQSVQGQTFQDWEAIVVDDGSTDSTAAAVARSTDPRIRYVYQENQGLSAARNTGICSASGACLAFLDADDEWQPGFLERCLDVLRSNQRLAGVYSRTAFIDVRGTVLPQIGGEVVPRAAFRGRLLEGGFFPVHAVLIRTDVLRHVGTFDPALTSLEDWDLWLRVSAAYEMQGIPEPLAYYRVRYGSMSTDAMRMHANRMRVLAKHFGPPQGEVEEWPQEKRRAFGFAYRDAAFGYVQQEQPYQGWHLLSRGVTLWPPLLERLDTFYELACGDQPRGYRGRADRLDIERNGSDMLRRLERLLARAGPSCRALRGVAYGNAYLALGMLSDQAGHWNNARRYLARAVYADPHLLGNGRVIQRLIKVWAGRRLFGAASKLAGRGPGDPRARSLLSRR